MIEELLLLPPSSPSLSFSLSPPLSLQAPIGQVVLDLSRLAIGGILDTWLDVYKLDEDHEIDKFLAKHQVWFL